MNPGPADNGSRLSAHCANEPQRQAHNTQDTTDRQTDRQTEVANTQQERPFPLTGIIYINLYSPHNTVESTDRVTDTNKREIEREREREREREKSCT